MQEARTEATVRSMSIDTFVSEISEIVGNAMDLVFPERLRAPWRLHRAALRDTSFQTVFFGLVRTHDSEKKSKPLCSGSSLNTKSPNSEKF